MSDIPEARRLIAKALRLMKRVPPTFRHRRELHPLSKAKRDWARELRGQGLSLNKIANILGTNIGRVSEAVNGKRKRKHE